MNGHNAAMKNVSRDARLVLRLAAAGLLLALAACGSTGPAGNTGPEEDVSFLPVVAKAGEINTRDDVDRFIGQRVTILGRLRSIKGEHGLVVTPGGLVVGLPHFDIIAHGTAWFDYLGRPVEVTGILHAPNRTPAGIPNFDGPTLEAEIRSFRAVD